MIQLLFGSFAHQRLHDLLLVHGAQASAFPVHDDYDVIISRRKPAHKLPEAQVPPRRELPHGQRGFTA
jgi:hypothetical protein